MVQNIPQNVRQSVARVLNLKGGDDLLDFTFSGGGCINPGGQLTTAAGTFFLKWNSARIFPLMFDAEAKGLELLRGGNAIKIPDVIGVGHDEDHQYILLEFMGQGRRLSNYWRILGAKLAELHRNTDENFGLGHNNYIGSLPQVNTSSSGWVDFFIRQRLDVQLKFAVDSGLIDSQLGKAFESLLAKLPNLLPEERPALIHGDLWSGNIISTHDGQPCLIDPAVYYGCREVDLAMTILFGNFPKEFYEAYNETFPLGTGYEDRFDLYNLYPLLVHLNLFGAQYKSPINAIVTRFV